MKPKTKIQKKVARLSANLRPISATQIDWAYRHCIEHIGYRTKKGNITCSDCGHEWYSNSVPLVTAVGAGNVPFLGAVADMFNTVAVCPIYLCR